MVRRSAMGRLCNFSMSSYSSSVVVPTNHSGRLTLDFRIKKARVSANFYGDRKHAFQVSPSISPPPFPKSGCGHQRRHLLLLSVEGLSQPPPACSPRMPISPITSTPSGSNIKYIRAKRVHMLFTTGLQRRTDPSSAIQTRSACFKAC